MVHLHSLAPNSHPSRGAKQKILFSTQAQPVFPCTPWHSGAWQHSGAAPFSWSPWAVWVLGAGGGGWDVLAAHGSWSSTRVAQGKVMMHRVTVSDERLLAPC